MQRELQGHYVAISTAGETAHAFVPHPLPPIPAIEWTPELRSLKAKTIDERKLWQTDR